MKKVLLLLLLLVNSVMAEVHYRDLFDAYDDAAAENKRVMIMISQVGCRACVFMEDEVFNDKEVANYLNKHYIVVHIDKHKDSVPNNLEYFATPTFFFMDDTEKVIKRVTGGRHRDDFLKLLKEMRKK